nr:nucleotidyltransferase family protein [Solimonas sp. SE-A11]
MDHKAAAEPARRLLAQLVRSRWTAERLDEGLLAAVRPMDFFQALRLHGLAGLMELRHRQQMLQLPQDLYAQVAEIRRRGTFQALQQAGACLEVAGALEQSGIPVLPLKGVALSWLLYRDIGARQSGDIDMMVDTDHVLPAIEIILRLGYSPATSLPQRSLHWREWMRSVHHINFVHPRGLYLELHWRTDPLKGTSLPRLASLLPQLGRIDEGPLRGLRQLPAVLQQRSLASHACRSRCMRWKWGYDLLEIVSVQQGGASPWRSGLALEQDSYTRHTLAVMAAQLEADSGPRPLSVRLTSRAATVEQREWMSNKPDGRQRTFVDGLLLHAGACAALAGWPERWEYFRWVVTRTSPEVGEHAYSLAAHAPWLAPLLRILPPLRRVGRRLAKPWRGRGTRIP